LLKVLYTVALCSKYSRALTFENVGQAFEEVSRLFSAYDSEVGLAGMFKYQHVAQGFCVYTNTNTPIYTHTTQAYHRDKFIFMARAHAHANAHTYTYTHMYLYVLIYMCVLVYIYIYLLCIYICIYILYICMYTYCVLTNPPIPSSPCNHTHV
jgi:hypothetical protein